MDDIFSNVIFVVVVAAVFIVRTVLSLKKKKDPPPPPRVEIPVHFEDDKAPVFVKDKAPAGKPKKTVKKLPFPESSSLSSSIEIPLSTQTGKKTAAPSKAEAEPEENNSPFNLDHLSPLKQAVLMAEILGPPKGLS